VPHEPRSGRRLRLIIVTGALLVALGLGWFGGSNLYRYFDRRDDLTDRAAINVVVERIISVESNGDTNAKNTRSSATGPGQFLNETWLDLIRMHRPDLTKGRSGRRFAKQTILSANGIVGPDDTLKNYTYAGL